MINIKIKKIEEIIVNIKNSANVKERCSIYNDMKKQNMKDYFGNDLADEFKLWADTWIISKLKEIEKLME